MSLHSFLMATLYQQQTHQCLEWAFFDDDCSRKVMVTALVVAALVWEAAKGKQLTVAAMSAH